MSPRSGRIPVVDIVHDRIRPEQRQRRTVEYVIRATFEFGSDRF